jgi:hypothetical protein
MGRRLRVAGFLVSNGRYPWRCKGARNYAEALKRRTKEAVR